MILLCDPHPDTRTVYATMLRYLGARVAEAADASEAIALARGEAVTGVVTELLYLPDGTFLPRALHEEGLIQQARVYVVTAEIRHDLLEEASAYADAVRVKPFSPRDLAQLVLPA